ncbi:MAG TPA: DUF1801 domain-containing protein [Steroidobacteraceae bacterium]
MAVQAKSSTIDEYLHGVPTEHRRLLQALRRTILSIVPDADECISYGIPAFRLNGVVVAGFCARAKGCSYFPFSGTTLKTLARSLTRYEQTKSSLHFSADEPLPTELIRKLISARMKEA